MGQRDIRAIGFICVILLVAAGIGWIGSHGSVERAGWPLFVLCGALAFGVNWIVFVPSFLAQTEHYFDLTGSLTYISLILFAWFLNPTRDPRSLLLAALVILWALRLGTFLFRRVKADGSDGRFDKLKPHFPTFLMVWTLQGLWVFLTLACVLAAMTSAESVPLGSFAAVGVLVFLLGWGIEILADSQKSAFRRAPGNRGRFIDVGLWAWSRHPNYFGEITLWVGLALVAFPTLYGWRYFALISPLFVFILLTRISGIPLLAARGKERWGEEPAYQEYLARTSKLVPRPPRNS